MVSADVSFHDTCVPSSNHSLCTATPPVPEMWGLTRRALQSQSAGPVCFFRGDRGAACLAATELVDTLCWRWAMFSRTF